MKFKTDMDKRLDMRTVAANTADHLGIDQPDVVFDTGIGGDASFYHHRIRLQTWPYDRGLWYARYYVVHEVCHLKRGDPKTRKGEEPEYHDDKFKEIERSALKKLYRLEVEHRKDNYPRIIRRRGKVVYDCDDYNIGVEQKKTLTTQHPQYKKDSTITERKTQDDLSKGLPDNPEAVSAGVV